MPNYQSILNRMPPNAVGRKRIQAIEKAVDPTSNKNWYVTGATLGDSPNYTLSLARNGGLSDVTVNLSALSDAANPGGSSNDVQYNNAGSFGGITLAKGKILSANGSGVPTALAAGTNTYVLTADSTETTGLKWAAAATGTIGGSIAEDRIAVGASTANTIAGYSTFEWDAATLKMTNTGDTAITLLGDANRSGENSHAMAMRGKWDGTVIGTMMIMTGPDTTNKDDGQLAFYTASAGTQAERMRIDETGNVGIGTTAPNHALEVAGTIRIDNGTTDNELQFDGAETVLEQSGSAIFKQRTWDGSGYYVPILWTGTAATQNLQLHGGVMTLSGSNVGIGTTSPAYKLDVVGTTQLSGAAKLASTLVVGTNATVSGTSDLEGATTMRSTLSMYGAESWPSFKVTPTSDAATIDFEASGGNASTPQFYPLFTLSNIAQDVDPGGGGAIVYADMPTIHFQKLGPRNAGNTANTTAGFRFLASGLSTAAATTTEKQYLVWTYQPDESSGSPSEIAKLDSTGIFTATTFAGELSGTIDSATTATTQSSGDNSTKVATTAYADAAAGGGGTPGGSDTQVQFNNGGSFGGSADLTWDGTNLQLLDSKKIVLGTGDDFQIYHNATNNYISGSTGDMLFINTASDADMKFKIKDGSTETEVIRIVGATSSVGIGTTSAINSSKVSIVDTAKPLTLAYDGSNYATFKVSSGGALTIDTGNDINLDSYTGITNYLYRGTEKFRITAGASSPVIFQPKADAYDMAFNQYDGNEVMRITDNQRVGIGTTSPGALLHIDSDTTGDVEVLRLENSNASTTSIDSVTQSFRLRRDQDDYSYHAAKLTAVKEQGWTNSSATVDASLTFSTIQNETTSEKMRITSDGNVGIGTTGPSYSLDVYKADADGNPAINISDGSTYMRSIITDAAYLQTDDALYLWSKGSYAMLRSSGAAVNIQAATNIVFKPNDTAYMTHDSGGLNLSGSIQLVNGYITSNPGANHLWASGATLFWGSTQVGTTTPGAGAIEGTATAGQVSYGDGSNSITSSANFTYTDSDNLTISSASANKPELLLKNTNAGDSPAFMIFQKDGGSAADGDEIGQIQFKGDDDGGNVTTYADMYVSTGDVTDTTEDGEMVFRNIYNGTMGQSLKLGGHYNSSGWSVWAGKEGTSGFLGFANNTADNNYLKFGSYLTTGSYTTAGFSVGNNAAAGNQQIHMMAQDDITISAGYDGSTTDSGINFQTNNTAETTSTTRMRIDKTGNVGIGTTSPNSLLEVVGTNPKIIVDGGGSDDASIELRESASYGGRMYYDGDSGVFMKFTTIDGGTEKIRMAYDRDGNMYLGSADANDATSNPNMFIDEGGKVGIGTTTPAFTLDVNGDIRIEDAHYLRFGDDDSDSQWAIQHAGADLNFAEVGVADNVLFLEAGGDVGVGLNNPTAFSDRLSVQIGSDSGWPIGFTNAAEDVKGAIRTDQGDNYIAFASKSESDIRLFYNDNEANTALIVKGSGTTAGNVGMGTTAPVQPLHVLTSANDQGILIDVGDDTHEGRLIFGDTSSNAAGHIGYNHALGAMRFFTEGTEIMRTTSSALTVTGTISATAKSFNIEHPLYKDKRLVHGSLEGPEHGIYIRGTIESKEYGCEIELPDYWEAMCDDYTVQLTPHGPYTVYINEKQKDKVMVASTSREYKFDYYVVGSRTDETLEVVQDA